MSRLGYFLGGAVAGAVGLIGAALLHERLSSGRLTNDDLSESRAADAGEDLSDLENTEEESEELLAPNAEEIRDSACKLSQASVEYIESLQRCKDAFENPGKSIVDAPELESELLQYSLRLPFIVGRCAGLFSDIRSGDLASNLEDLRLGRVRKGTPTAMLELKQLAEGRCMEFCNLLVKVNALLKSHGKPLIDYTDFLASHCDFSINVSDPDVNWREAADKLSEHVLLFAQKVNDFHTEIMRRLQELTNSDSAETA